MPQTSNVSERNELNLTSSVKTARDRFPNDEAVSAVTLAQAILDLHRSDYAGGKASNLSLDGEDATIARRPAQAWLEEARTLFDESLAKELHGRLVIIGLSLLDSRLRRQLQQDGFLDMLEQELKEPLAELLTEKGWNLREPPDTVPNQPDDPLKKLAEDQLGRAVFAQYLAERIFAIPASNSGAYSIHVYGPWGSGKSTLLNFLRAELLGEQKQETQQLQTNEQPQPQTGGEPTKLEPKVEAWKVITFNAWQHQHIQFPCWALLDHVFQQGKSKLSWRNWLREYWWRFSSGRLAFLIGITVLAWLLAIVLTMTLPQLLSTKPKDSEVINYMAGFANNIGAILALLVTIWAGIQAVSKPLFLRSTQAAQSYIEFTSDPMNEIKRRFNQLIRRIPRRVAIFIDDLDRCQSQYVVELMESIQTLFREAPVVFVVAADRRWLNACYEDVYDKLKSLVHEPGKPLGTLFLEKMFQFSTSVPGIPEELKTEYWQSLIQVQPEEIARNLEAARQEAREEMAPTKSEGGIMHKVRDAQDRPFLEQRAIREAAVLKMASPGILERTEHVLKPFAPLLEPNPRAMKRLVNSYSVNRALAFLAHIDIERNQLALWTILSLRWPQLADYLEERPEMVEKIGQKDGADVAENLQAVFNDQEVVNVISAESVNAVLDREAVERCARLRS